MPKEYTIKITNEQRSTLIRGLRALGHDGRSEEENGLLRDLVRMATWNEELHDLMDQGEQK